MPSRLPGNSTSIGVSGSPQSLVAEAITDLRKLQGYFFLQTKGMPDVTQEQAEKLWTQVVTYGCSSEHPDWTLFVKAAAGDQNAQDTLEGAGITPGAVIEMYASRNTDDLMKQIFNQVG